MNVIIIAVIAFIVLVLGSVPVLDKAGCASRWQDSGRKFDWSFMGGCRVTDKNGNLIPEKNLRDVQ